MCSLRPCLLFAGWVTTCLLSIVIIVLCMAHQRTYMLLALILASPLTALLPFTGFTSPANSSAPVTSEATVTYTSTSMSTHFRSTTGPTVVQEPVNFSSRVIGFIAPKGKCAEFSLPVTVTSNTTLNVEMSSNSPANFYLLPTYPPQASSNTCSIPGDAILTALNFTQFLLHWTAQADGTFYFIFTGPTTVIVLADRGSVKPILKTGIVTFATSTQTNLQIYAETTTTSYTDNATPPVYLQLTAQYAPTVAIIVALLSAILFALGISWRFSSQTSSPLDALKQHIQARNRTSQSTSCRRRVSRVLS